MNKPRILLVEDETNIRRFVHLALTKEDMWVFEAATAEQGRMDCATRCPELIIVDLGLPDADGKSLMREVRTWNAAPILVLSAREQETEKVEALDAGGRLSGEAVWRPGAPGESPCAAATRRSRRQREHSLIGRRIRRSQRSTGISASFERQRPGCCRRIRAWCCSMPASIRTCRHERSWWLWR